MSTLRSFMVGRGRWEGTATNLLEALVAFVKQSLRDAEGELDTAIFDPKAQSRAEAKLREAREKVRETLGKDWPGNPRALSGRLKKAGPALRQIGVAIEWPTRHGDARIITITSQLSRPLQICVPIVPCVPSRQAVADHSKSKQRLARRRRATSRDANGTRAGRRKDATSRLLRPTISALNVLSKYARLRCWGRMGRKFCGPLFFAAAARRFRGERGAGGIKCKSEVFSCA